MSVFTLVGCTALTRIDDGASASARSCTYRETPRLACEYPEPPGPFAGLSVPPEIRPATEPVATIDAPALRCRYVAETVLMTPTRSTSTASMNACGGTSPPSGQIPAFATTMSRTTQRSHALVHGAT